MSDELKAAALEAQRLYRNASPHIKQRRQCQLMGMLADAYLREHSPPSDGLGREELAQVAWIKNNLNTTATWTKADYEEFYAKDVGILLAIADRVALLSPGADDGPRWRDRPPVRGYYAERDASSKGTGPGSLMWVENPEMIEDGARWYGPIPLDGIPTT